MDINNVPQENISTYANNKKAIYARDVDGSVKIVASTGWNAEEVVTKQALQDLKDSEKDAYYKVKAGIKSTLYFHMYAERMDLQILSDVTGFFQWTIKRDFEPKTFAKISKKRLSAYAEALGKSPDELKHIEGYHYDSK